MTDPHQPATSPGTSEAGIERRAAIAETLGKEVWPADRDQLIAKASETPDADGVVADLQRLPEGQQFATMQEVADALGIGTEQERF